MNKRLWKQLNYLNYIKSLLKTVFINKKDCNSIQFYVYGNCNLNIVNLSYFYRCILLPIIDIMLTSYVNPIFPKKRL